MFDRLPHLMYEIELRAARAEDERVELERARADRAATWERVRAEAEVAVVEHHRAEVLGSQVRAWHEHHRALVYLGALEERIAGLEGEEKARAVDWLGWCRRRVARMDPLRAQLAMPADPEMTPEALKPSMRGLSPRGVDSLW